MGTITAPRPATIQVVKLVALTKGHLKAMASVRIGPSLLVDQDLALTQVETPRGWGVPCPHASRRCPP
jgi:hypothetical protein